MAIAVESAQQNPPEFEIDSGDQEEVSLEELHSSFVGCLVIWEGLSRNNDNSENLNELQMK